MAYRMTALAYSLQGNGRALIQSEYAPLRSSELASSTEAQEALGWCSLLFRSTLDFASPLMRWFVLRRVMFFMDAI